jgi:hypothetical protein
MSERTAPAPLQGGEALFRHIPHPRLAERKHEPPVLVRDQQVGFNGKVALLVTAIVGTMWAAYIFALIAFISLPSAINSGNLTVIIAWVSSNFLQLVLLPVIIVGQNIQGRASDKRALQTYKDAEAILEECIQLQAHLAAQDKLLDDLVTKMRGLAKAP